MKLVIVESPAKTKTIKQYLGDDYNVLASKGHIRDIKTCGVDNLGVDEKNGYKPIYEIIKGQESTVKALNSAVSQADKIYLATDPDREGEAISWHLNEVLNLKNKYVKRIEFNEITPKAVKYAVEHPRDIDMDRVKAQQTRQILDKLVGYKLSPVLWKQLGNYHLSAGRVQSAALRIICDRESEINAFIPTLTGTSFLVKIK